MSGNTRTLMNETRHDKASADPFESDITRRKLAASGNLTALKASYEPGTLPELADMSSTRLWDELAACSDAPAFRIRRLQAVADQLPAGANVLDIEIGRGEIIPMVLARGCSYFITMKRRLVDLGRRLFNAGETVPLNIVIDAHKKSG